ncbi:hypothetical protein [Roseospira visakhapatnamensis]|uniref:Uncharacterized protein n=1 Tax=Roseospira visakhapatnamensis TaxID=390880 RepID=A0A7W6RE92_9PROT|nr:hypothetical protein [Roseospira visakhapatnamensis]MBB4266827.1 hypothetical protein [Roseospira visakhapatnamensis]
MMETPTRHDRMMAPPSQRRPAFGRRLCGSRETRTQAKTRAEAKHEVRTFARTLAEASQREHRARRMARLITLGAVAIAIALGGPAVQTLVKTLQAQKDGFTVEAVAGFVTAAGGLNPRDDRAH